MKPIAASKRRRSSPALHKKTTGAHRKVHGDDAAPLVLIVDDHDDSREMYSTFLLDSGLRVALAVDGDHGLWKVAMLKPNVIVMDLAMPVIDGWEAIRQIKAHPTLKSIPIIALTGHATPDNLERASAVGADVVLTKPQHPVDLLVAVQRLIRR